MTAVAGAREDSNGGRVYPVQGRMMPSANTVLEKLDRPALNGWKYKGIALGVASDPVLQKLALEGSEWKAAMRALDAMPTYKRDMGTAAHLATEWFDRLYGSLTEAAAIGEAMHAVEEECGGIDLVAVREHLMRWVEARRNFGIIPELIELTVCHMDIGYAGTMDRAVRFKYDYVADMFHDGCRLLHVLDVKTGEKVYPDVALQEAGYANCTHAWRHKTDTISLLNEDRALCHDVGIVASLHADACELRPIRLTEAWPAFTAAVLAWRWAEEDSHAALGDTIPDPSTMAPW